jgi:hypothetical protein
MNSEGKFRKTTSNRVNRLASKSDTGNIYAEFGEYLIRRKSDDSLQFMTEDQAQKELEF